jgi:hypothetical protein
MARIARLIMPGIPHHVAQRGNRREEEQYLKALNGDRALKDI